MAFIRADLRKKNDNEDDLKRVELTDEDVAILALQDSDNLGPSFCYTTPSRVPIYFFGDISGLNASITPLVSQVLADTEGDRSCELLSMDTSPEDVPLKDLPFKANAAYIRYQRNIYYVNRTKEECGQLKKITRDAIYKFDHTFAPTKEPRLLEEEELKKVCRITGHFHNNLRPVFVYRDPNAFNNSSIGKKLLEKQSEKIAKLMQQQQLRGPFCMVAYSYSALLAVEVMQYFTGQNIPCFLYVIDAPAPEVSQKFLLSQSGKGTYTNTEDYAKTLLEIVNYAARLTGNDVIDELEPTILYTVKNLPPSDCIEALAQLIYKKNSYKNEDMFEKLIAYEKLCLDNMMNYDKVIRIPLKGTIAVLPTDETFAKYSKYSKDKLLGWNNYADKVEVIGYKINDKGELFKNYEAEEAGLLRFSHQDIIKHVKSVSKSIVNFFNRTVTNLNLTAHRYTQLSGLCDDTFGSDPEFAPIREDIRLLIERKIAEAASHHSSPINQSPQPIKRVSSTTNIIAAMGITPERFAMTNGTSSTNLPEVKAHPVATQHVKESEPSSTSNILRRRR